MPKITKTSQIEINITPEDLKDLFWEMTAQEQAEFFSLLGDINPSDFHRQMAYTAFEFNSKDVNKVKSMIGTLHEFFTA